MTKHPETMHETDAVELLVHQHEQIRHLFSEVEKAAGERRAEAFGRLVRLLAVHETAEEEVVHPIARRHISNGDKVVQARLEEEHESKTMLQALEKMGTEAQGFDVLFAECRRAVFEHAESEEQEEFPELRARPDAELRTMAVAIRAAQATAPTHPHPGVETATENLLIGPFAAVADRTRDIVRKAMGRI